MHFTAKESGCLSWLKAALGEQRDTVASLMRRLTDLSISRGMKPTAFRKFLRTLEQIAVEKDIETEIGSRIYEIETRHRLQRGSRTLRSAVAGPKTKKKQACEAELQPMERESSGNSWPLFMGLVALFSRRGPRLEE